MRLGCDLVSLSDFTKKLSRPRFKDFVFASCEVNYCEKYSNPAPSYAARFAAKEAFVKALGTGFFIDNIHPRDIWVESKIGLGTSKPKLGFSKKAAVIMKSMGLFSAEVSMSHTEDFALATVILY